MIENEDGRVSGSIDRARVAELLAETSDDELKAYYQDLLGGSPEAEAVEVEQPAEAGPETVEVEQPAEAGPETVEVEQPPAPSMAMSKPELVELAQGKVDDPESKTKAELVEALGGDA
jgi:hypothetical protein